MNTTASEGSVARARAGLDPLLARARNPRSPRAFPHLSIVFFFFGSKIFAFLLLFFGSQR